MGSIRSVGGDFSAARAPPRGPSISHFPLWPASGPLSSSPPSLSLSPPTPRPHGPSWNFHTPDNYSVSLPTPSTVAESLRYGGLVFPTTKDAMYSELVDREVAAAFATDQPRLSMPQVTLYTGSWTSLLLLAIEGILIFFLAEYVCLYLCRSAPLGLQLRLIIPS